MSISVSENNSNNILSNIVVIANSVSSSNVNININRNDKGSYANIVNNSTITTTSTSSSVSVNGYGPKTTFYYEDTSTSLTEAISIEVSINGSVWDVYETVYPLNNYNDTKREYSTKLNLNGINSIRIRNLSTSSVNGVYCYIMA